MHYNYSHIEKYSKNYKEYTKYYIHIVTFENLAVDLDYKLDIEDHVEFMKKKICLCSKWQMN